MELAWTHDEKKWRQYYETSTAVDTARLHRTTRKEIWRPIIETS